MIVKLSDLPNKELYYKLLCSELESMGLEDKVVDVSKKYLRGMFGLWNWKSCLKSLTKTWQAEER